MVIDGEEHIESHVYVGASTVPGCVRVLLRVGEEQIVLSPDAALETAKMLASWAGWAQSATTHMQVSDSMTLLVCGSHMGTA